MCLHLPSILLALTEAGAILHWRRVGTVMSRGNTILKDCMISPPTLKVFSFFEVLFHISCIIASTEKKTHSPHRLWPTCTQNWSFVLFLGCAILQTMWRRIMFPVIIFGLFSSVWSTAPALSSLGAGRPEWLSVHAAPPELHLFGAPLQRQRWPLTGTGPGHLHRCTRAAALPSNTLIILPPPLMKAWSNLILLPVLHSALLRVFLIIPFCNTYSLTVPQKHRRFMSNFVQHIWCLRHCLLSPLSVVLKYFLQLLIFLETHSFKGTTIWSLFCCPLLYYGPIKLVWVLLHICISPNMIHLNNSSNILTCCFIIYTECLVSPSVCYCRIPANHVTDS